MLSAAINFKWSDVFPLDAVSDRCAQIAILQMKDKCVYASLDKLNAQIVMMWVMGSVLFR